MPPRPGLDVIRDLGPDDLIFMSDQPGDSGRRGSRRAETTENVLPLRSVEEIREHVRRVLCERDRLDCAQVELRQAKLTRQGKPCGLMFQVNGPRLLRTYAVWAGEEDRILFYESTGSRFAETKLIDGPTPAEIERAAA